MNGTLRGQEKLFIIGEMPLFAGLSAREKKLIAEASVLAEYKKYDIVYKEGDPPDALYCVVTGRLKAYVAKGGRKEDLEYLKRGKYFGIISLLTGEPHSVTVEAVNDSIILKISKTDFDTILKRVPELAIHFGQTLSRRLKRKDTREKKIFESTIITIFGASDKIGSTTYALNLGVSLKTQTRKKVILLTMGKMALPGEYFGIEIRSVPHKYGDEKDIPAVISLASDLTNEYHFVLLDIPGPVDKAVLELMRQSDVIHLITAADGPSLHLSGELISRLEKSASDIRQKVKIVTSEYGLIKLVNFENRRGMLKHDVYAALPDINKTFPGADKSDVPITIKYPDCEYSKAIRRISRELGECLIGLALGSGAAHALAHIGVLKVIEREKIPIDIIAATSMGAVMGAFWASGRTASEIEAIIAPFRKKIKLLRLVDLAFPKKGLLKGKEIKRFLHSQFGDMTFHDLKLPFKVVTCDIETREEVVLDRGRIVDAIMASVSIPGLFEPVTIGGRLLVDGGIINPVPTNVLMKLGVGKIIAVNTLPSPEDIQRSKKKVTNIFDLIVNHIHASEYLLAEMSCQDADIAMHPVLATADWYEIYKGESIIKRGEEEASKYLLQLKELVQC